MSPRPFARIAGWITLAATAYVLVLLIRADDLGAWFILAAPAGSAALSLRFPTRRAALALAFLLLLLGTMPMLYGGYGAAYLPALGLLLAQIVSPRRDEMPSPAAALAP